MTTLTPTTTKLPERNGVPLLVNGDRMSQAEFHRRYVEYEGDKKFELIGGIVYMAAALSIDHSDYDGEIGFVLELYRRASPGVKALHNATTILSDESEPQPDLGLFILPECGGQAGVNDERYFEGAPELIVEITHSRRSLDLHAKRDDYEKAGVVEYIVVCVQEHELVWFHFPTGGEIKPDRKGIARSLVFPGLWFHVPSLLALDSARNRQVVEQGLASRAHTAFIRRLARARRR